MRRRDFIVGAGVAISAFAGCLGEEQVALSERPPENAVEDAIRTAIGESNTVALELASTRDEAGSAAAIQFDEADLQGQLDDAGSQLDDASEAEAAGEYQAEIEAARTYVGVVEGILQGTAALVDAAGQLQTLESDLQAGNYDAARQELEDVQPTIEDAGSSTSTAQSDAEGIDAELLDPYGAKMGELEEGMDAVANLSVGADELTTGYESLLDGQQHLDDGRAAYERRAFDAAASEFASAQEAFDAATDHFETAREETGGELDEQIDVARCRSTALSDGAGNLEASANAAGDGNLGAARSEQRDGQAALETAQNCG